VTRPAAAAGIASLKVRIRVGRSRVVDLIEDTADPVAARSPAERERRGQEAGEGTGRDDDGDVVRAEQWCVPMHADPPVQDGLA
jgi:hypothetical protein